jgi:thioredoxin reductase (NADPH)
MFSTRMTRPVLLIVDPDAHVRQPLADVIARRYGADYQVLGAANSTEGLDLLQRLADEGDRVAIVMADVWLLEMDGVEFVNQARVLHPGALRVLLANMGDVPAMEPLHRGMALGELDFFLIKEAWQWPEDWLYPQIQEALSVWSRPHGPKPEIIRIVGEQWSPRSHELRDLLTRNIVPFGFYDWQSAEGMRLLQENGIGTERLPVLIFFDGTVLADPANAEVAETLGVRTKPGTDVYDVAIVGAGPAGLAAAVYGASEGLRTVVLESQAMGGQAGTSSMIRNYLGFPRGVSGSDLTSRAYEQALHFGAEFIFACEVVGGVHGSDHHRLALADGGELAARAVIIATGVTYRRLGIPKLESLIGAGVFYGAALTEAQAMTGQDVFIVGAGNSAGQAAVHIAKYASRVTLLVRGKDLASSTSDYLIQEIENTPNIDVRFQTQVVDGLGQYRLTGLVLENLATRTRKDVPAAALFVMIGATPHTDWVGTGVQRDGAGYLLTGRDFDLEGWMLDRPPFPLETSVPGLFAVGDVRANSVKRVASAVGEGSVAIRVVHEYLAGLNQ